MVRTVRLVAAWALSMAGVGLARIACWIAGTSFRDSDPTFAAIANLRDVIVEIPSIHLDDQPHDVALVSRAAVLGAIGQALTEAEE